MKHIKIFLFITVLLVNLACASCTILPIDSNEQTQASNSSDQITGPNSERPYGITFSSHNEFQNFINKFNTANIKENK